MFVIVEQTPSGDAETVVYGPFAAQRDAEVALASMSLRIARRWKNFPEVEIDDSDPRAVLVDEVGEDGHRRVEEYIVTRLTSFTL